jgi:site-specific DNA-methyltransferase (adenine-specific)
MTSEPRWRSPLTGSEVYEADALTVAEGLPGGCASLAILDGPYGMGKAEWDRVPRGGRLADLYRPHLDALGRVCAASATVYVWNTAEGWAELHAEMLGRGWRSAGLVVWHKPDPPAGLGWASATGWIENHELCGVYRRGRPSHTPPGPGDYAVWTHSVKALSLEQLKAADPVPHRQRGTPVMPALHPCQKPLLFAERMLRASSRPGDVVWVPFGGTLRELVAAERMARQDRAEARRVVTCELNGDGVDYIGAALAQVQGLPALAAGQVGLFG